MKYNPRTDRYEGDGAGLGPGWPHFMMVEWELGARVALLLDDPQQSFWELDARRSHDLDRRERRDGRRQARNGTEGS